MTQKKNQIQYLTSLDEIPEFTSVKDEVEFWDTHSVAKIWDQLETIEFEIADFANLIIDKNHHQRKAISFKLEQKQIKAILEIAKRKNLSYQRLIKHWIEEGIQRESIIN